MLTDQLLYNQTDRPHEPSRDIVALLITRDLFDSTQRKGALRRLWAQLRGREVHLLALRDVAHGVRLSAFEAGRIQVPITRIVGSENRDHDFDRNFVPLKDHTRDRWLSIATAWYSSHELPPVQLIQIGDDYYVRDGHHRVSVARAFGATSIDAYVEVWQVATALQPVMTSNAPPLPDALPQS